MAIADHIIFSAYGFWLPNDPRGSGSDFIRSWELLLAGRATKVHTRRSVAHVHADFAEDREPKLQFPPVIFDGKQALVVSWGIGKAIEESGYVVYACSIMPEHVHLVVKRHKHRPKQIAGHVKGRATQALVEARRHPLALHKDSEGEVPSPWGRGSWDVFLDDAEDIWRSIKYVERNPEREGKKRQTWPFVKEYRG